MIVGIGVIVAVAVAATGGGTKDKKTPTESTGRSPGPSLSLPSGLPSLPSGLPTELVPTDLESFFPSLADDEVPYYMLQKGDCFDTDDHLPGQAVKRTCTEPHDAEVVKVAELDGTYTTNAALKKAASTLCQGPLERKAAGQAAGTVRDTLVQYPDTGGYKVGIDKVACSLAADVGKGTHKLTKPLK
ncbi:hypothetical protein [Streptomyces sp. NPDC006446]|uniref:hypothetical protein n=1 Tax=Streptomyces sp. NPDC006446 TaxID=3154301 RepID=UPI0033BD1CA5